MPDRHSAFFAEHAADLDRLSALSRRRVLAAQDGIDFSSNDYLGLARSPQLAQAAQDALARGVPVGSGGSRLLRGNHPEHVALEAEAAAFFGSERALWFSSGFAANETLFSTLPQRGDLVVHDELIHASVYEGLRIGRAERAPATHNDANAFDVVIRDWRKAGGTGRVWIAVESLYSMDGDFAPLADLAALADAHDGVLVVDEAHAVGVFGPNGRGLAAGLLARGNVITLVTCGKALGCEGALVCAPGVAIDFLINRGRGLIFSTAPSPLMAAVTRASLGLLKTAPELRETLMRRVALAEGLLGPLGTTVTGSQILPLIVGEDAATMTLAAHLQAKGFDVRGIRPPTVPEGTARLRISITNNASESQIAELAEAIAAAQAS